VARTIYTRIIEDIKAGDKAEELKKGEVRDAELRLADCYQTLGDISCETGKSSLSIASFHIFLDPQACMIRPVVSSSVTSADGQKTSPRPLRTILPPSPSLHPTTPPHPVS
jgi:hypothetical protein